MINTGTDGNDAVIGTRALLKRVRKRQEAPALLRASHPSQLWVEGKGGNG